MFTYMYIYIYIYICTFIHGVRVSCLRYVTHLYVYETVMCLLYVFAVVSVICCIYVCLSFLPSFSACGVVIAFGFALTRAFASLIASEFPFVSTLCFSLRCFTCPSKAPKCTGRLDFKHQHCYFDVLACV